MHSHPSGHRAVAAQLKGLSVDTGQTAHGSLSALRLKSDSFVPDSGIAICQAGAILIS